MGHRGQRTALLDLEVSQGGSPRLSTARPHRDPSEPAARPRGQWCRHVHRSPAPPVAGSPIHPVTRNRDHPSSPRRVPASKRQHPDTCPPKRPHFSRETRLRKGSILSASQPRGRSTQATNVGNRCGQSMRTVPSRADPCRAQLWSAGHRPPTDITLDAGQVRPGAPPTRHNDQAPPEPNYLA